MGDKSIAAVFLVIVHPLGFLHGYPLPQDHAFCLQMRLVRTWINTIFLLASIRLKYSQLLLFNVKATGINGVVCYDL